MTMSDYDDARFNLDVPHRLDMATLTGDTVTVVVSAIDTDPQRVLLLGEVEPSTWDAITNVGAFHTELEPGAIPGESGQNVEITLVLRKPIMDLFANGEELFAAMFGPDPTPLRSTEAWLLGSAMQAVGVPDAEGATASSGYRTKWAPPIF